MNELKNTLFPIIVMALLSSCGASHFSQSEPVCANGPQIETAHRSSTSCAPNPNASDLLMSVIDQQTPLWCWAACGEMVMKKLGDNTITQCDQADSQFHRTTCCNSPIPDNCINGGWPQFEKYGFSSDKTQCAALNWDDVKTQIDCQRTPFVATWKWLGSAGGGHMVVVSGYRTVNQENFVYILNPLPGDVAHARWLPYSTYVSPVGYSHWDDFFNIRRMSTLQNAH